LGDTDSSAIGTAALGHAIVVGIVDALELRRARQTGDARAGLRSGAGGHHDGAFPFVTHRTRTAQGAVSADGASGIHLGALAVVVAFALGVRRTDSGAVDRGTSRALIVGIVDTDVSFGTRRVGRAATGRHGAAEDADATAVGAAGGIAIIGLVVDSAVTLGAALPLNAAAGQRRCM
jgi:hypothetical protein